MKTLEKLLEDQINIVMNEMVLYCGNKAEVIIITGVHIKIRIFGDNQWYEMKKHIFKMNVVAYCTMLIGIPHPLVRLIFEIGEQL